MAEHNDLCGQFARAFGNDAFEAIDPRDEMVWVVSNHDAGWAEWDAAPALDPHTRLPAGIGSAPPEASVAANGLSPLDEAGCRAASEGSSSVCSGCLRTS